MGKAPQQPAPTAPGKFPPNWSKMTMQEKTTWQQKNRPGFDATTRAAKPPTPAQPPTPVQPAGEADDEDYQQENADQGGEQNQDWQEGEEARVRAIVAKMLREMSEHLAGGNGGF